MPLAHGLQPFPGEGPSARANHGGRCPQMQEFFRPSKLRNYHHFGRKIRLDESQKLGEKKHDSNPNLCCCSARIYNKIVKNEKLSIPQKASKSDNPNKFESICTLAKCLHHTPRKSSPKPRSPSSPLDAGQGPAYHSEASS